MKTKVVIVIEHPDHADVTDLVDFAIAPLVEVITEDSPEGWSASMEVSRED